LEQRINQTIEFSALACKYIIITLFMPGAEWKKMLSSHWVLFVGLFVITMT
jgi:hypothetical protein